MRVPEPKYSYQTDQLATYYKDAVQDILIELDRVDIDNFRRANANATLASISEILSELDDKSKAWVEKNIPKAARDGVINTIVSLGVAETIDKASQIASFSRLNKEMVAAAVADTQADLLAVTQNIDRKTKAAVRKAVSDSMRYHMTRGTNGRRTIASDIRNTLQQSVKTGIIDGAGRRWRPEVYADMATRTKMMETYREATTNEALRRNVYYAKISSHGAKDACRFYEGRIMKLTEDAPGNYPTYDQLKASGEIFHPNCKHVYSPIRNPEGALF
ncbi:minor capsid protein [Bacillus licheniformis]|uniref:phage minor capsid protein n=1 Tax=Bacillus TaxID=1386 RepID=UPI0006548C95|nr:MULTISPECIES: phage minor capsid protein [Bacillus]KRT92201.1 type IV secretion protein Rhs [Bacillus paralicheniformis]MBT1249437.1 minor capsid protein [Bacillus licheniformis]MCY9236784.1 phage minor capsid protein [Bacillus licheniformis]MED1523865.1 minor capsid protein [Bacillus licheniformis]MED4930379.1 minor capsid protein [Bacillus licheniformis]